MSIRIDCPECQARFQVDDRHAGKKGRCPRCKTVIQVPEADKEDHAVAGPITAVPEAQLIETAAVPVEDSDGGTYELASGPERASRIAAKLAAAKPRSQTEAVSKTAPQAPTRTPAEILAAFRGKIEPVRPTPMYRASVLLVAGIMVLLPLIYLALIGLVGWAVYWHASTNHVIFGAVRGRNAIQGALFLYAVPLVLGALIMAFMLKPLLARPPKGPTPRKLDPHKEPLVFAFVDGICTSLGAPTPARIEVDCEVNASAHLDKGPFSSDLILTIGLPLASGLSLRQFAGVLAHEFGHFSQRTGMRVSYLIRSINLWFARVVYERDSWDQSLGQLANFSDQHYLIAIFGYLAQGAIWLTRRVLWILMKTAQLVSSGLSHQMEFDADRYEARMVGGATVGEALDRARILALASQGAYADLNESWKERRLPDDLPRLVMNNVHQIREPILTQIREANQAAKTELFSSHPADAERAARALADTPGPGLFQLDGPATDLFRDFADLCKTATRDHYRGTIGLQVHDNQLYPVEEVEQTQQLNSEGFQALRRFFRNRYTGIRPIPLPSSPPEPAADVERAQNTLIRARESLESAIEVDRTAMNRLKEWRERANVLATASTLLKTGVKFKAADFQLTGNKASDIETAQSEATAALAKLDAKLGQFEKTVADRLATALALIASEDVMARVDQGELRRDEARALFPSVSLLGRRVFPQLPALTQARAVLQETLERFQKDSEPHTNAVLRASRTLHDNLTLVRTNVGNTLEYPFEHAQENATLGRFMFGEAPLPAHEAVIDLMQTSDEVVHRLVTYQARALGRLCLVAEQVELALGLPVQEVPPEAEVHTETDEA